MLLNKHMIKAAAIVTALVVQTAAYAVPSYSRQTGDACTSCHVGAFGPQLTPHGIAFKLGGYTDNNGSANAIPLSGMVTANFTKTSKDQGLDDNGDTIKNNKVAMQEFSAFFAGQVSKNIGVFSQVTYSGADKTTSLDHIDVRYAKELAPAANGKSQVVGLSVNNGPTSQDPFNQYNTLTFPYIGTDYAPTPDAATLLEGRLDGQTLGISAYTLLSNGVYLEGGAYTNQNTGFLRKIENIHATDHVKGLSPYARLAYYQDNHSSNYSVGLVGLQSYIKPVDDASGASDKFTDVGIDANYQFLGDRKNICGANFSYIYEKQNFNRAFCVRRV